MCFLVTFCTMQKVTTHSLCREHRGSANLDSARRNGGFARTKLKPSQRELRGSANLEAAHKSNNFAQTQLNPLPLRLPPHGRLAHVRSQFSLFRRSPTHKNLPPATYCTSEQLFPTFCKVQKVGQKTLQLSFGKFALPGRTLRVQMISRFSKPRKSAPPRHASLAMPRFGVS